MYVSMKSTSSIYDLSFRYCTAVIQGGAILSSGSDVKLTRSSFTEAKAGTMGGGVYAETGWLRIYETSFVTFKPSALYVTGMIVTEVENSEFKDGLGDIGGAISCFQSEIFRVANTRFTQNVGNYGGAVYIQSSGHTEDTMTVLISNNSFSLNSAFSGGALYLNSANSSLTNNTFTQNSAVSTLQAQGRGGGIFLSCDIVAWCNTEVSSNVFLNNSASDQGGALSWSGTRPSFSDNFYMGNNASYGHNVASFAVKITTVAEDGSPEAYVSEGSTQPTALQLTEIASGQASKQSIKLGIFDHENKLIANDHVSTAELATHNLQNISINGNVKVAASGGVFTFNQFSITALPGSTQYLTLSTTAVDVTKAIKARDGLKYHDVVIVQVQMRLCNIGESQFGQVCFTCTAGTYSLDPSLPCQCVPRMRSVTETTPLCRSQDTGERAI